METIKVASYVGLDPQTLAERAEAAREHLAHCDLCGWECGANRLAGKFGVCKTGEMAYVSSYGPHYGEENPLRGWRGSGTIFFAGCNLRCQYCQNYEISQFYQGHAVTPAQLAEIMLRLQAMGCHNINFVSPSHVIVPILQALVIARSKGLRIPLVYNTGGYDSLVALKFLEGIVDIYMPDMKYSDASLARKYSKIPHYPETNQQAVKEMHRQVGDLVLDEHGIAQRGLLIRHLVLPNRIAGSEQILRFIVEEISPNTYVNIMEQYRPLYLAHQYPELNRRITLQEYEEVVALARSLGLRRLDGALFRP
ncbi:MAG: radical SAM protein [Anaerolineales bacterium]|nr:radical SAM protein [Anaerolineales bacterium]MDW8161348.1 radical SAM protein [Anaerolineales bacterium]